MTSNRSTWFTLGCWSVLLVCIIAGLVLTRYQMLTSCYNGRVPLGGFVVNINTSQRQLLIEKSQKFANENGFEFDLAYLTPSENNFRIDMIRDDVEVIMRNPFKEGEFKVGFYNYDCIHPTNASDIEPLVTDLKSALRSISSVIITEEK